MHVRGAPTLDAGPGGSQVLALVHAWDSLAVRLPPQASMGSAAQLILTALKLALAHSPQRFQQQAVSTSVTAQPLALAWRLADLSTQGLPLDAEAIAASILLRGVAEGDVHASTVRARLGPEVSQLLHDIERVRSLPTRVDLWDDTAAT